MTNPEILEPQDWTFPIPIAYGSGRLSEIGQRCAAMGLSNPLIVTDKGSRDLPFISQLHEYLAEAGLSSGIFSDISPNPRDDLVLQFQFKQLLTIQRQHTIIHLKEI